MGFLKIMPHFHRFALTFYLSFYDTCKRRKAYNSVQRNKLNDFKTQKLKKILKYDPVACVLHKN